MNHYCLKTFKTHALVALFFFLPQIAWAQFSSILADGLGVEIGIGHNQLFWQADEIDGSTNSLDRTAFSVLPSARIHYTTSISANTGLYTFIGYNEFGGRSGEDSHPSFTNDDVLYKDRFRFQNLEAGFFGLYRLSSFTIGLGTKINNHLKISQRHHFQNHPQGQDGWGTSDVGFFFKDWSIDGGIRVEYLMSYGITFGGEGWFGLSDLSDVDDISMDIRQNHFRILIGYRL